MAYGFLRTRVEMDLSDKIAYGFLRTRVEMDLRNKN
jgi:hypothetical protein